ncbi:MAG: hypothetical protein IAF38_20890 [Bacteroidia bacterium]|nr:hypothetical protein [Bacteroidia bacterium]
MKRLYVFLALALSFVIYAFYRNEHTVINVLLKRVLSDENYFAMRNFFQTFPLPKIIIFSLPEGLWIFCATVVSGNIFIEYGKIKINLTWLPIMFCALLEFMQLIKITNGTFDVMDILVGLIFWLLALASQKNSAPEKFILNKTISLRTFYLAGIYGIVYLSDIY